MDTVIVRPVEEVVCETLQEAVASAWDNRTRLSAP